MGHSFSNKFNRFYDSLSKLIRIYLVGIVIFMVFRIMHTMSLCLNIYSNA